MNNSEMCKGSESKCDEPRDLSPIMNAVNLINEKLDSSEKLQCSLTERLSMVLGEGQPEEPLNDEMVESDIALLRDLQMLMLRIDIINDRFKNTLDRIAL